MKLTSTLFADLAVTLALGLMMQPGPCLGAAWEGTDDFSGTLAKWDTTYIHPGLPSDGFFPTNGYVQFIKTETTGALLLWPHSLPFNTNWTVLVDAHLKPLSVKTSNPIDQDVRAALWVFENIDNILNPVPNPKALSSVLQNGTSNDEIRTVGMEPTPIPFDGWDFTLGISYDASSRTATSFYYPSNQSSRLVILTNLDMSTWTNMLVMFEGLSEYWAVGSGEVWLDNFKVQGNPSSAAIGIVKAVIPSFNNLILGRTYQLQVSTNLTNWSSQGTPFVATNFNMAYPQYWAVDNWSKLFFRLQVLPQLTPAEICANNLRQIYDALQAYARDYHQPPTAPATLTDCMLYLSAPPVCPAGGTTKDDSYTVTCFGEKPTCISPGGGAVHGHVLPR